jgi:predicted flap endonuclease-1-like 5' DNA nuclease
MAYKVEEIEGIGPAYAKKLGDAGIASTNDLLDACADAKGREAVAAKTGINAKLLLTWANMADLMRISGIGEEYSQLLEAAGVDTVKELRNRNADNLAARVAEVNAAKKLTRRVPTASEVGKWVEQAKKLEPRISH